MLSRLRHRLRLVWERRKLAQLETALGVLGWQQADYDPATQQHADQLNALEREQARLANESATLGLAIREIEERRAAARREFEEAAAAALAREQPAAANAGQLAEQAAAKRRECEGIETRLRVLDREAAAAEAEYRARLTAQAVAEELLARRRVILALPRERADWQARLEQAAQQAAALETLLESLRKSRADFEQRDAALAGEIAAWLREKQRIDQQADALDAAKTRPYREIGRALADHDISPLNQPDALDAVHAQRERIVAREALVAASLGASHAEDAAALRTSWIALGAVAASFAAIVLVLASL